MIDEDALLASFVDESQQHLQTIEPDLLELERGGDSVDSEVLNRIFRSIHSIKGASGFFGLQRIGELSHAMESLLSLLRDRKISVTRELTDSLLSGVDMLRAMVDDVAGSEQFDIENEVSVLRGLIESQKTGKPQDSDRKVTVVEKTENKSQVEKPKSFSLSEDDFNRFVTRGKILYSVKLFLNADLRSKGKTPFNYISEMELLGTFVDSFLDTANVNGLDDCLDNDIAFNFLFATVLEPDLVPGALELPEERITVFDLEAFKKAGGGNEEPAAQVKSIETPVSDTAKPAEKSTEAASDDSAAAAQGTEKRREPAEAGKTTRSIQAEDKLRVGVSLLNELVNLAGELVLGRNQLMEISAPLIKQTPGLNPVLQHVSRVTTEMQEKIMQLRMQPVSVIFGKFHRVVRDISRTLKKEILLETYGDEVELDKSIIESLSDPLTHLIRNSADHGVETPDVREKAGKPRQGKIILKAYHEGGQVHLAIIDDGKGIDAGIVGRKAIEKGVITQQQLSGMSEKDVLKLIFRPGFSTAQTVSSVSGRGVGMDVVRTNIEHLGGTVEIDTEVNKGTTIELVLPLTLAIVSGLAVKVWDQLFILPEANIDEMVRIKPEEIKDRINSVQNAQVLRLRDMIVPLIDIRKVLLGLATDEKSVDERTTDGDPLRILILKYGTSRFGLIVDTVENMEEIVVKPLPKYLKKMKGYSGATIMGNGKVALILDVGGLIEKAALRYYEEQAEEKLAETAETGQEGDVQNLLVFDNGTEERFALPLELITRIERVPISKIEKIKEKFVLQYQGENLRLLFLEDYLPIARPDRQSKDKIGVIVPKQITHPMGIVINQPIDTVTTAVKLDTSTVISPGLFGSAVIEGRVTLLPDMYRLFELAEPQWYGAADKTVKREKRKKNILLVEDAPFFRMIETEYLESAGYKVVQAEDGAKALKLLDEQQFDAMVLDIVMPVLDGWGVIKAVRENPRIKDMPVLAVTSLNDEETARKGYDYGFDDWEAKLNKTRLIEKLDALLSNKQRGGKS